MSGAYSIFSASLTSSNLSQANYHVFCELNRFNRCLNFILVWLKNVVLKSELMLRVTKRLSQNLYQRNHINVGNRILHIYFITLEIVFYIYKPVCKLYEFLSDNSKKTSIQLNESYIDHLNM